MSPIPGKPTTALSTKAQAVKDTQDGVLLKQAPAFAPAKMEDVFGSLPHDGPPLSIEEMDAAIWAEVKRRHARGRY